MVQVWLKQSKTDTFRNEVTIYQGKTQVDLSSGCNIGIHGSTTSTFFVFRDESSLTCDRRLQAEYATSSIAVADPGGVRWVRWV